MRVILAKPRGFCAGVDRAITIVEKSLQLFGLPLYVRHAIVHNRHEVERLKSRGVIFVEDIAEIPEGSRVILSAHGSSPLIIEEAKKRNLTVIDAVCPLVAKVHSEVKHYAEEGRTIILVGHKKHIEVVGTRGEAPDKIVIVESVLDAESITVMDPEKVAYTTQTTLSVDDTKAIISVLKRRFPKILGPRTSDICYATQNRQDAVKKLAEQANIILVVGSEESSNSNRLVEVARARGVAAYLVPNAHALSSEMFTDNMVVGVSSGASTPEILVEEVTLRLKEFGATSFETLEGPEEHIQFGLPKMLTDERRKL